MINVFNLFTISRYKPKKVSIPVKIKRKKIRSTHEENRIKLGKYITKFRKKRGYMQYELAIEAGVSKSCISRIERGVTPLSVKAAIKIGRVLKVNLRRKRDEINV